MATKSVAWQKGSGNITLSPNMGQGNGTVVVSSDPNDVYEDRSQTITFTATASSATLNYQVTVSQGMKEPNLVTKDGHWIVTKNDKYVIVKES